MFLNITPTVTNWTSDNKQFSLVFEENPLADFVELPDDGRAQDELWYSNILCGVLRGALEMVCLLDCVWIRREQANSAYRCKFRLKHTLLVISYGAMTLQRCELLSSATLKTSCLQRSDPRRFCFLSRWLVGHTALFILHVMGCLGCLGCLLSSCLGW